MDDTKKWSNKVQLPGFGLRLDEIPENVFPSVFGIQHPHFDTSVRPKYPLATHFTLPLTTLREFTMLQIMNQISDKPGWGVKVFKQSTLDKWKAELLSIPGKDITERMIDWCFAELQTKASTFQEKGAISVYNGDVVKSDTAVSEAIRELLETGAKELEDASESQKDWHPGSNGKVLDLVHPSLFPLVYGMTRILPDGVTTLEDGIERCGEGTTLPIPSEAALKRVDTSFYKSMLLPYSQKFQWLPCEVDVSWYGTPRITSYINNLHPTQKHSDLYSTIEQVIAAAIPLWNMTLTPLRYPLRHIPRIHYTQCSYNDPWSWPEHLKPQKRPDEDDAVFSGRKRAWFKASRRVILPEPEDFHQCDYGRKKYEQNKTEVNLYNDYTKTGLQIIVKMANIHLTPENPEYEGGSWHVEGQLNEHICATAIYYYSSHNITPSRLSFRQQSNPGDGLKVGGSHDKHVWLPPVFGCEQYQSAVQNVGSVWTPQGRLITFPNILHHQVQPFRLEDPTKEGHRKILALFLVDPNIRIISTANVPCQRKDWWAEEVGKRGLNFFPAELIHSITEKVEDFPISMEKAKELRLELMEERTQFVEATQEAAEFFKFNLCEH